VDETAFKVLDGIARGGELTEPDATTWVRAFEAINWIVAVDGRYDLTATGVAAHRDLSRPRWRKHARRRGRSESPADAAPEAQGS
jgi:hypothetical protein